MTQVLACLDFVRESGTSPTPLGKSIDDFLGALRAAFGADFTGEEERCDSPIATSLGCSIFAEARTRDDADVMRITIFGESVGVSGVTGWCERCWRDSCAWLITGRFKVFVQTWLVEKSKPPYAFETASSPTHAQPFTWWQPPEFNAEQFRSNPGAGWFCEDPFVFMVGVRAGVLKPELSHLLCADNVINVRWLAEHHAKLAMATEKLNRRIPERSGTPLSDSAADQAPTGDLIKTVYDGRSELARWDFLVRQNVLIVAEVFSNLARELAPRQDVGLWDVEQQRWRMKCYSAENDLNHARLLIDRYETSLNARLKARDLDLSRWGFYLALLAIFGLMHSSVGKTIEILDDTAAQAESSQTFSGFLVWNIAIAAVSAASLVVVIFGGRRIFGRDGGRNAQARKA